LADDKNSPLGSWRIGSDDNTAISVLEGMKNYKGNTLLFERGPEFFIGKTEFTQEISENTNDKTRLKEAVETAKKADVVVMVLGEHGFQSGEARSKTNLDLPQIQQELLEEVYNVNPNIVLVLNNGRPLTINWADNNIPSIVEAWQLGTQTGNAVAQVLYGDYNPSGKLPMTFPRSVGQIPIYYNYKNTGRPTNNKNNVFWSHFIDGENTPLYPFGHGLSYSTFTYSNLELDKKIMSKDESIKVSVNLTNTSEISGKEVVQLYIRDLVSSITRPVRELKGFELVELNAGETKTIEFKLNKDTLGYYNNSGEYVVEEGEFKVFIGGSSITSLESEFEIK
jgi:beta-glucosidase